jgi:hypothetical protein
MNRTDFFAALFPERTQTFVEMRVLPSRSQRWFHGPGFTGDIEQYITEHLTENVYFGVATRVEKDGVIAGGAAYCGTFGALFADFDFKDVAEADVRARLAISPVPPSIVVATGGGLHVYWLLREPVAATAGAAWLRRLAATMGSDSAATDEARILRVPGTFNHKYSPPRPVTIELFESARRYALADFDWLKPDPKPARPARTSRGFREIRAALKPIDMIAEFEARGLYIRGLRSGKHAVTCPWADEHSCDSGDTQTIVWPPDDEHDLWGFKCLHEHKGVTRTIGDVIKLFGVATVTAREATEPEMTGTESTIAPRGRIEVMNLSDVDVVPVPWLWPGYLPLGSVVLLVGDPDLGKSLTAFDLAARVTTGKAWPDGVPNALGPANVLILSSEDRADATIRPRIEAAEGDCSRVKILTSESAAAGVSLARDTEALGELIARHNVRFAVFDPLSAYLPGIDSYRDNEVRSTLAPLVAVVERQNVTVLAVVHMTKNVERSAMQRIMGSTAFNALARATFGVVRDPDHEDRRLFLPIKANLTRRPAGLAFSPTGARLEFNGKTIETARAVWAHEPVPGHIDDILRKLARGTRPAKELDGAMQALLKDGPVLAKAASEQLDRPEAALRRARERLGIESLRDPAEPLTGPYFWLPPRWAPADREAWFKGRMALRAWKAEAEPAA